MSASRARIIKGSSSSLAEPLALPRTGSRATARIVKRVVVDADAEARRIVADARIRAEKLIADAERAVADVRLRAEVEGRADGMAALAAQAVALAEREARTQKHQLSQTIDLARLLAERLLGESLGLAPERVVALARQALLEARGARQIKIVAEPNDAAILSQSLAELGVEPNIVAVEGDARLERGNLRVLTDIGTLDAELTPQLARLSRKLKEALQQ